MFDGMIVTGSENSFTIINITSSENTLISSVTVTTSNNANLNITFYGSNKTISGELTQLLITPHSHYKSNNLTH